MTAMILVFPAALFGQSTTGGGLPVVSYPPIPSSERMALMRIARDTWGFYAADGSMFPRDGTSTQGW